MSSYYSKTTNNISGYYSTASGTEPNMRREMINTLEGFFPEVAKAQTGVLRRMRKDSEGHYVPCACVDGVTKEGDKDFWCPYCCGLGRYFDEEYVLFYKVSLDTTFLSNRRRNFIEPGKVEISTVAFYFEYDVALDSEDRIIELSLDTEGRPVSPLTYQRQYRIDKAWDMRCDNGKLEYWKVFTHEETVRFLQPPAFEEAAQ